LVKIKAKFKALHKKYLEHHVQNKKVTRKVDQSMAFIGVVSPFATFIQVFHIFATKLVAGISLITWIIYVFVSACWVAYGFFYKDKPLMVVNSLSVCASFLIIVAYLIYK
jgi:uncharacterized protein with PQ loop repeat